MSGGGPITLAWTGASGIQYGLRLLAQLPVDPALARACDEGRVEQLQGDWLDAAAQLLADTLA